MNNEVCTMETFIYGQYSTPMSIDFRNKNYKLNDVLYYREENSDTKILHFKIIIHEENSLIYIVFWEAKNHPRLKEVFDLFNKNYIKPLYESVGQRCDIRLMHLSEYLTHQINLETHC